MTMNLSILTLPSATPFVDYANGVNVDFKGGSNLYVSVRWGIAAVKAPDGWLQSRKVADKMSHEIAPANAGQALMANLAASNYLIGASKLGLPVSSTHVTLRVITDIGLVREIARFGVIRNILLSWVLTLPIGAMIVAIAFATFQNGGN
jgi:PiT family inorganic phosphate transporter